MTTMSLRPRRPFMPLPLDLAPLSPASIPQKRGATGSGHGGKVRRVSGFEADRAGAQMARGGDVTPTLKRFYETDELGVGRSPARRLFVDEPSHGISGTTPPYLPKRSLAPSPPISTRSSPAPSCTSDGDVVCPTSPILNRLETENGADIHDPGFVVHRDQLASRQIGTAPPTPESKRASVNPTRQHAALTPTMSPEEDQENVPPVSVSTPHTPRSIHHSPYSPKSPGSSRLRKTLERSRLGREVTRTEGDEREGKGQGEGEELTPGRRTVDPAAKRALVGEVNRI